MLLGLLGRGVPPAPQYAPSCPPVRRAPPGPRFFPAIWHRRAPKFRIYGKEHGGRAVYDYLLSAPFPAISASAGQA